MTTLKERWMVNDQVRHAGSGMHGTITEISDDDTVTVSYGPRTRGVYDKRWFLEHPNQILLITRPDDAREPERRG